MLKTITWVQPLTVTGVKLKYTSIIFKRFIFNYSGKRMNLRTEKGNGSCISENYFLAIINTIYIL